MQLIFGGWQQRCGLLLSVLQQLVDVAVTVNTTTALDKQVHRYSK